jgi:hypothetical protein
VAILGRKKKEMEVCNGVVGKTCGKCKEWRQADAFNVDKQGVGGLQYKCRNCQSTVFKKYYKENEDLLRSKKIEYHHNNREARRLYDKKYYAENQDKVIKYRKDNRARYTELTRKWRERNKERGLLPARLRRARIISLPNDLTNYQQDLLINKFKGCALTESDNFDFDHVIPLTVGHGGTTYGNMIPLRHDLNQSKGNRNIFEWFEANRQRFNLSQEKFDSLIEWLAEINEVTVDDYTSHVYWCHENPHSLDDLRNKDEGEAI